MKVIISGSDKNIISESESISKDDLKFESYSKSKYASHESFWNSSAQEIRYSGTHIARHHVNVLEDVSV